ncbi:MFS transporter, partial [Porticoccaceae bacterium]|nr:MFS transporter [Porticoccaceae bacterium]
MQKGRFMRAETPLSTRQQFAYALPMLGIYFLIGPLSLIQGIYTTYFGVTLSAMAAVLLIVNLFDAVTDPLIGYLSDRQHARSGSRKSFVVSGGILMIVASYFLYVPVDPNSVNASTHVSTIYLLVCYFAFFLSSTLIIIPHMAWASEVATTAQEKNSIFAWRVAMMAIGSLLFSLVPFLPFFETTEFTPKTLEFTALVSAFLIVPALLFCVRTAPKNRDANGRENRSVPTNVNARLRLSHVLRNKPLLLFILSFVSYGLSAGTFWALSFIFVNSYLDMGVHYALVAVFNMISSILFIKVWVLVAAKINRKIVWALGLGLLVIGTLLMMVLEPGRGSLPLLLLAYMIIGSGLVAGEVIAPVILSDIIDYHQWK